MKKVKVTIIKTVVLCKEEILEIPDTMNEEQLLNKASDVIYHNGEDWNQKQVNNINFKIEELE
jgi:hypothetical protein